ncbi:SlyX family protein [Rubellimicrobium sp. CFH 75288]|uniref:SlyX family protein n=1 Tax=Rubellimicrobium sp. CFH 75288 TaxID=2697034 RepID=UPI00144FA04A|nr:SlyX family protein [Rubellimicrobium sp. CFH 75288]NAZ37060.1 SlyX protein [Rubellimicrobium sp. CFH 75288]
MSDIVAIEERLAHLIRAVDDLSDEVARQGREMAMLRAQLERLVQREAEREAEGVRAAPIDRPPHW